MPAGYSSTPFAKKLGLKPGYIIKLVNVPEYYFSLFTDLPAQLAEANKAETKKNFIHFFTKDKAELLEVLPRLKSELLPDGMIWVAWVKKSAGVATDVDESAVRNAALSIGLVDIKVCAIDEIWSGLKLVVPLKDRANSFCE